MSHRKAGAASRKELTAKRTRGRQDVVLESLALTLLSGILTAIPFLAPGLFWLHWVALVPWIVLLTREHSPAAWLYFLFGAFTCYSMAFGPFSALHIIAPFWSALVVAPLMVSFALLVRIIYLRWQPPLVLLVPVAWVAGEWLRLRYSVGQVGLFPLGSSQYRLAALIQIADFAGLAGITFVVGAANGAVVDLWRWRLGRRGLASAGAFVLLLAAVLGYGQYRLATAAALEPGPRIAVIQPNEVHYRDPAKTRPLFDDQLALVRAEVPAGTADLVALPENAIDYPYSEDPYFARGLRALAREQSAAVLAGAFAWAEKQERTLYTSAVYVSRAGEPGGRYDKIYLVPWAEYLPFHTWLPRVAPKLHQWHASLAHRVLGYVAPGVAGDEVVLFPIESGGRPFRFAVPICYEVGSSAFTRRAAAAGADFMVNISSEGFFGAPLYFHMWSLSTIRAVETRLAVVRATNNGISGFIDPLGRTRSIVRGNETGRPYLEPGTLVDRVPLAPRADTFYTRCGDLFAYLCLAASAAWLVSALAVRKRG